MQLYLVFLSFAFLVAQSDCFSVRPEGGECPNTCTHELNRDVDGAPICVDRAHVTEWTDEPCPCFCGLGTTKSERECVWYEGDSIDSCEERRSKDNSGKHPCGNVLLSTEKECYNGTCTINKVVQKTQDVFEAGSNSAFYYTAYTFWGQICDIGHLDLSGVNDRQRGQIDKYFLTMPCNACMKSSTEIFDYLKVTIDGTDGWKAAWIMVEVNGNNGTYYNPEWLDNDGSLIYNTNYDHDQAAASQGAQK